MGRRWMAMVAGALLVGCGGSDSDEPAPGGGGGGDSVSFADLRSQVFPSCSSVGCHASSEEVSSFLILNPGEQHADAVYQNLVNAPSRLDGANVPNRVVPGDPGKSFLYWKVLGHQPGNTSVPVAGLPMPSTCTKPCLPAEQQEMIRKWIAAGAPRE